MKRRVTFLAAALLLAFLIPPLAMRGQTWEATELSELTSSDVFVIVSSHATNGTYAMSNDNGTSSAPSAVSVTVSGDALSGDIADNIKWNISGNANDGYTFYPNGETESWLYCTATNNGVRVGTNSSNVFTIDSESGYLVHSGTSRYIGVYNGQDWRCYTSINNNIKDQTFTFYKYDAGGTPPTTYTITYKANGPEEDDIVETYNEGASVTVAANTFTYAQHAFTKWNTLASGTGTDYMPGDEIENITANIELYAQWEEVNTYTVTYYANVPGTAPIEVEYNEGENVTVAANTFSNPGYAFTKWNTEEGGTGTDYMPNEVIENITANIDLYAQWEEQEEEHWVLANLADLTANDVFVIVSSHATNGTYAMSNDNGTGSAPSAVAVTVANEEITGTVAANIQWNISGNATDGYTFYPNGSTETWLYCTATNNGVRVGTNEANTFKIEASSGYLVHQGTTRYLGVYNSSDWRCYTSINNNISGQTFSFYKKVTGDVLPPSISAEDVEIAYNATSGSFTFTISNPVEGATLSVLEEVDWIDEAEINNLPDGYSVTFATTVNEGVAREGVITLTYNYNRDVVTKTVTVTQAGNPNAPGTENNPYTVAQAIEAINAGAGTEGVYATGVVSEIVTPYSTQYSNITFDFIDEGNTEAFLRAYRCVGEDAANVEVGDVVVVYGNLTQYDELYEFAQGCSIVSLTHPVSTDPSITFTYNESSYTPTDVYHIELPCDASGGYVAHVVSENFQTSLVASDFHVEFCDVNGDALPVDPDWLEFVRVTLMPEWAQDETLYLEVSAYANETDESRTAYFKVWALNGNDMVYSSIVTITQAEYVVDYATLPFEFNGGSANIENTNGLTQEGLGSDYNNSPKLKFDGTGDWMILKFNETPGTLTFDIKGNSFSGGTFTVQTSEDGVTYSDLQAYTELGNTQSESFDNLGENVRYIKWIYTEKGSGNVALGNIMLYQYGAGPVVPASITVSPATVNEDSYEHDGTLALSYENLTISGMSDFGIQYYDAEGAETTGPDWIEVLVAEQNPTTGEGYVVSYYMLANEGEARSAYFKVFAMGDEDFVYSNLVTINQAAYVAPFVTTNYTLATAIESGRHYIITNGADKAMGAQASNNRPAVGIVIDEGVATVSSADVYEFVVNGPDANGFYTIYDATVPGYLYAAGANSNNYLRTQTFCDNRGQWNITFDEETNAASIAANFEGRNNMRFNSSSNIFSCYASGQQDIYLYVKDDETNYEFYKDIAGFGEAESGNYYLIASPVADANVRLATTGDYDLYAYDEPTHHWLNQKVADNNITTFVSGQGYLYANKVNKTLHFEGEPNTSSDVTLTKTEGISLSGMNLVGNPFSVPAYINRAFYVMNAEGTEFVVAERNAINPMEGVFVEAASNGETLTFSTEAPASSNSSLSLNLRQTVANRGGASTGSATTIDRAIIRFGESQSLPKFMLNENNTKLYIPQGEKDYAMVSNEGQGELPVNFKAAENGSYTLCVNTENVEMDYLHLIDNMTGADVDLLLTPSYTFEASTRDYATRFRLVFSTNSVNENAEGNANFAFFDGNEWVINSTDNATLQVVDLMGRILSSETFSGSYERKLNAAPGVYMLRLINGNDVKVQKIVVK